MSNPATVARTAPIAIAPKPPRGSASASLPGSYNRRQDRFDLSKGGMPSHDSESHPLAGLLPPPCESCRMRRIRCTMASDEEDGCSSCQTNNVECSLASSPQLRKRKLNGDYTDDVSGKRRLVSCLLLQPPSWVCGYVGRMSEFRSHNEPTHAVYRCDAQPLTPLGFPCALSSTITSTFIKPRFTDL
jgi:hypothetical protein